MKSKNYLLLSGRNKNPNLQNGQGIFNVYSTTPKGWLETNQTTVSGGVSQTSKKGYLFTFDLVLSLTIAFSVILVSIFFLNKSSEISISDYQALQMASDIVWVMDVNKTFDTLNYDQIEIKLENLLPANYDMLLRVEGDFAEGNGVIEVGGELPESSTIISGQRTAITDSENLLKITYFIWVRE